MLVVAKGYGICCFVGFYIVVDVSEVLYVYQVEYCKQINQIACKFIILF